MYQWLFDLLFKKEEEMNEEVNTEETPVKRGRKRLPEGTPCKKCNVNPRQLKTDGTGYYSSYCRDCNNRIRYIPMGTPKGRTPTEQDKPCRDCGINPRYLDAKGRIKSYCLPCQNIRTRATVAKAKKFHEEQHNGS